MALTGAAVIAADVAPPAAEQYPPGTIIIKPTGRKRVSRVGQAPPPPEVDWRILARGDSPQYGGPVIHYPVGYYPVYYGDCYSYCSPSYGGFYGYSDVHRGYGRRCGW